MTNDTKKNIELLKDRQIAQAYIQRALEIYTQTGEAEVFLQSLRNLTMAQGGMTALSRKTGINRQNLYRTFAETGNPKFKSLGVILQGLGFKYTIESIQTSMDIKDGIDSAIDRIIAETNVVESVE
jgi:probable addiction module antidote protein